MFLTTKQAADRLGLSTARVRKFRAEGRLVPAATTGDSQALYSPEEIARFAALVRPWHREKKADSTVISKKSSRRKSNSGKTLRKTVKKSSANTR